MSNRHKVRKEMLERVRRVGRALEKEVLRYLDQDALLHIDGNLFDALRRARTELARVELQLEAELREGTHDLTCAECGTVSRGDTTHWKAYLTSDDEIAIYCPDCCVAFELWHDP